jgi:hypothetical protein
MRWSRGLFCAARVFGVSTGGTLEPHRRDRVSPTQLSARETRNAMIERVELRDLLTVGEPVGAFSWVRPSWYETPKGRRCTHCGEFLPFSAFRPNLKLSSGWNSWCRDCCVESAREWRERNRERVNAARRTPPARLTCVECGGEFEGRKDKLICSRRCKDRRYARLHPEELREKQRRKYARRSPGRFPGELGPT